VNVFVRNIIVIWIQAIEFREKRLSVDSHKILSKVNQALNVRWSIMSYSFLHDSNVPSRRTITRKSHYRWVRCNSTTQPDTSETGGAKKRSFIQSALSKGPMK
jgi:hypothetical protein